MSCDKIRIKAHQREAIWMLKDIPMAITVSLKTIRTLRLDHLDFPAKGKPGESRGRKASGPKAKAKAAGLPGNGNTGFIN